jgi:hypothetical protein
MKGLPWLTGAQIGFGRLAARYRPLGVLNSSTAQQPRRPGRPSSGPRATARSRQKFKGCTEQGAPLAREPKLAGKDFEMTSGPDEASGPTWFLRGN